VSTKTLGIKETADRLVKMLSNEGFTIQRYDAYGTNSVYLKLDYGVCNSIRISDHRGKKHLKYMYNVLTTHKGEPYRDNDGFMRYYYKANGYQLGMLMSKICDSRRQKITRFGRTGYMLQMETARAENENNYRGFWSQAVTIHEGVVPKDRVEELNKGVIQW
jgi:hypothetical protein